MEYAVRGPIPQRAAELQREGKPIIFCNIGNPQALGQPSMTYYRQVLSLVEDPSKIQRERQLKQLFEESPVSELKDDDFISDDVLDLSEQITRMTKNGTGAYTESKGFDFIREAIAEFIDKRDDVEGSGGVKSDPEKIFLTTGASGGVKYVIDLLIADPNDGIMIPIPQYPLYSASIKKAGGVQVDYYPDEDSDWTFSRDVLDESLDKARQQGVMVKGIVVINPGNPTGAVLNRNSIDEVIQFAKENGLVIIADEVYQENIYNGEFISFAKALGDLKVPLFSLHSISKGFYGECGHRGGYLEVRNPPKVQGSDLDFLDLLLKQASVSLCSNTAGQLLTYLMVSPPEEDSHSYVQFVQEKKNILRDLRKKAAIVREAFAQMEGVECFGETGAMYLFPRLNKLPEGKTDFDYCLALLEETGLCTVNGSGFGQKAGTNHLRIAFLPPTPLLEDVLPRWIEFHNRYVNSYRTE
ncbi:MAG: aminotransferase class I/II-fold pyridoxal phosphate-dependent enzyme [Anaerolineales bacterium]|nr:aminotransferase class I/II-fold pyridoxal phosphate-dependent enzyme [Chloroflexota bacterium]MBL6982193.1 aminotransferase class I/II-fold pyridoxal phosphate-dependent enzyme [Anaerolineales bacterium]